MTMYLSSSEVSIFCSGFRCCSLKAALELWLGARKRSLRLLASTVELQKWLKVGVAEPSVRERPESV